MIYGNFFLLKNQMRLFGCKVSWVIRFSTIIKLPQSFIILIIREESPRLYSCGTLILEFRWCVKYNLSVLYTAGQKIKKSSDQKNLWNQVNQFHEKVFGQIPFFALSKIALSIFELGKNLKVPKMQFHEKNFLIYLILFYGFLIFWPTVR